MEYIPIYEGTLTDNEFYEASVYKTYTPILQNKCLGIINWCALLVKPVLTYKYIV